MGPLVRAGDVVCARSFQSAIGCADAQRGALLWSKSVGGAQAAGTYLYRLSEDRVDFGGNVVERSNGSVRGAYLFDTLGDGEPGGEWIADVGERVAGPHPSLEVHPCEYAVELIG